MFELLDTHPPLLVLLVLMAAFLMPAFAHFGRKSCGPAAVLTMVAAFIYSLHFALITRDGQTIAYSVMGWDAPWGVEVIIEPFSAFMLLVISAVCLVIMIYSMSSLEREIPASGIGWYYTTFLLLVGSMMGMVMTNDLFNMYVFIEVTGIAACALVLAKGGRLATEASFKYLLLATVGSGFVLTGIALIYVITGNLNISFVAAEFALVYPQYPYLIWTVLSFFLVGFGIKSALFPLHVWLPDAHSSAPTTSSAVLSGLVVKAYIVALAKFYFQIFGFDLLDQIFIRHMILIMATGAILGGSMFAFVQLDLKRRLAYSSVAQIGYIFLGLGLSSPIGLAAGILHIFNHAVMKACLFLAAGAIYRQTGEKRVNRLQGLAFQMPITMFAFSIAALSMVGLPLFSGFISKWYLALGSIEAGMPMFVGLIILSGLLNASYFLPIVWQAFFVVDEQEPKTFTMDKIPVSMSVSLVVLAMAVIYFGINPEFPLALATKAVGVLLH
ncbi:complex I subunit 5 family protein [Dethiobacter alkaliphilus]|uniref:complex I subunit 5 family protein n=1 Tax=Dethiobacter alkaliphilus TaxID=427926 RepID=UPI002227F5D6|nr:monovalent cation/H+ antiporter subunit D family protein [Dethiobacter alkaliphilus]MCW3489169.1 monovalent cation/H+ antiporter subunit D family protein [Dethiobacter alkaliphilus]